MPGGVRVPRRLRADSPSAQTQGSSSLPPKLRPPVARAGIVVRSCADRTIDGIRLARRHPRGATRLRQDDAPGAVGRAPRPARGVGVVREGRRRPRRAVDRRRDRDQRRRSTPACRTAAACGTRRRHRDRPRVRGGDRADRRADDHRARSRRTRHEQRIPRGDRRVRDASAPRLAAGAGVARAPADPDCTASRPGSHHRAGTLELAMSVDEAAALLAGADVVAPATITGELLERTEGWPVGLYLAALAMQTGTPIERLHLRRRRPLGRGVSALRTSLSPHAGRGALSAADVRARPSQWTAVRCRGRGERVGRHPRESRGSQHARRSPRPPPGVVPIPPPLSRAPAG